MVQDGADGFAATCSVLEHVDDAQLCRESLVIECIATGMQGAWYMTSSRYRRCSWDQGSHVSAELRALDLPGSLSKLSIRAERGLQRQSVQLRDMWTPSSPGASV